MHRAPAQMLWRNREVVMTDQILRAKGSGMDRLSNPVAYDFRRRYGRSYYREQLRWLPPGTPGAAYPLSLLRRSCRVQAGLCALLDPPHLW